MFVVVLTLYICNAVTVFITLHVSLFINISIQATLFRHIAIEGYTNLPVGGVVLFLRNGSCRRG